MTRRLTFIFSLGAALAFPAIASANCGTIQGSFSVTCEQGVQVFRHNALSGVPRGISQAEATVRSAEIRANTDRLRIESQERADRRDQNLREQELTQDDIRTRIFDRNTRRFNNRFSFGNNRGFGGGFGGGFINGGDFINNRGFGGGFGNGSGFVNNRGLGGGFGFVEPSRARTGVVRASSRNIQH